MICKKTIADYKLRIQDISSVSAYLTEAYNILDINEKEESYNKYFYFNDYKTWQKIIDRVNNFKQLVTLSKYEDIEHDHLDSFIVNYLNKCDYCTLYVPICNAKNLQYGKKHNDNIISCDTFKY